jgi:1-acyl-sn-glycerol-3-phosphate acyltransferase
MNDGKAETDSHKLRASRLLGANRMQSASRLTRTFWRLTLFLTLCAAWFCLPLSAVMRHRLEQAGWRQLLRAFGVTIRYHGKKLDAQSVYVSNHVSWIDIPVLSILLGAPFVAKSDIAAWPLLGALAKRYGCVFVDRNRRSTVREQALQMNHQIMRGSRIILFPEGTTGLGDCVLPFRSALFQPVAGSVGTMIQPVAICYRGEDGEPLARDRLRQIAWIDDDELFPHALTLALSGPVHVDVYFDQPQLFECRKAAAAYCWNAVSTRVKGTSDFS